jgi:hypothetical protein
MFKGFQKLLYKCFTIDKWNIGFVNQTASSLILNRGFQSPISWLTEDKVDYAADPFVVTDNKGTRIYYEELNFWKGNGEIMVIEDFDFKTKRTVSGITPLSIHLSYPYLIQMEKDLYCVPETSSALEIGLYKFDKNDSSKLVKQKVLLYGKQFVDTSIIQYADKYWLFTSVAGKNDQLFIYYADCLDGDYQPHELNPINVSTDECRGAGSLFLAKGFMYRPTQNLTRCYGGSIQISKVKILTESHFQAEPVFEILPDKNYNRGTHHISFANDKIVIDGKRRVFELTMPIKKLVRKIRQQRLFS